MAAAPVQPPDDPGQMFSWLEPHWAVISTLAIAFITMLWRAATLAQEIRELRADYQQFREERKADKEHIDRRFNEVISLIKRD